MNYNLIINTVYFVYGKNKYLTNFGQVSRVEKKQLKVILLSALLHYGHLKIFTFFKNHAGGFKLFILF